MSRTTLIAVGLVLLFSSLAALARPSIEELKSRAVLDDYESNVVFGYNIVMETNKYAGRYTGSTLACTSCHLKGGTQPNGFALNVAGLYPKWRSKNGVRNGLGLRIRDCFLYSLNGIMPPEESAEVQAVAAYVHYLSEGQAIGKAPEGYSVPTLPETGSDPDPARGQAVFKRACTACHGADGHGTAGRRRRCGASTPTTPGPARTTSPSSRVLFGLTCRSGRSAACRIRKRSTLPRSFTFSTGHSIRAKAA